MTRRLATSYLLLTFVVLLILEVPLGVALGRLRRGELAAGVKVDVATLAARVTDLPGDGPQPALTKLVNNYRVHTGEGRAVVVDASGRLIADGNPTGGEGRGFSSRPEVQRALHGVPTDGSRYSHTLHSSLFYAAAPVFRDGRIAGVVRITYPATVVEAQLRRIWLLLGGIGLLIVGVVLLLAGRIARTVTGPLAAVHTAARRLGHGDLTARAPVSSTLPELADLARTLNDTAGRLQSLVTAQQTFLADASHQLRTPLAALRLRLELMEPHLDTTGIEDLEVAEREVHRLTRLVDGLLGLAQAEAGHTGAEAVDLRTIVDDRVSTWSPLAAEMSTQLAADVTDSPAAVAMPGHLEQILDNLIANALDAASPGGTVRIETAGQSEQVSIDVLDDGPGMDADQRAAALEAPWRGSPPDRRLGGSGLGLSIVRRLAAVNGGRLLLEETPAGGLDARILLPASPPHSTPPPPTATPDLKAVGYPTPPVPPQP